MNIKKDTITYRAVSFSLSKPPIELTPEVWFECRALGNILYDGIYTVKRTPTAGYDLIQKIIEDHGGKLPGEGSTFFSLGLYEMNE